MHSSDRLAAVSKFVGGIPTPHRALCLAAIVLLGMIRPALAGSGDPIQVELNAIESVQSRCRLSFVVENKSEGAIESLKLDLAVFGREGTIQRRLVVEMGPVRGAKTMVRTFELDGDCAQIGSILVNDVTACTPGGPDACLDRLALSSRVPNVRLFK